jgi:hypothetical protein
MIFLCIAAGDDESRRMEPYASFAARRAKKVSSFGKLTPYLRDHRQEYYHTEGKESLETRFETEHLYCA